MTAINPKPVTTLILALAGVPFVERRYRSAVLASAHL
jgi:hypothetical protein